MLLCRSDMSVLVDSRACLCTNAGPWRGTPVPDFRPCLVVPELVSSPRLGGVGPARTLTQSMIAQDVDATYTCRLPSVLYEGLPSMLPRFRLRASFAQSEHY